MTTRLRKYWESFRSSFWFMPTLMAASSAILAFGTVFLDESLPGTWHRTGWIYGGGPDGARAVLSVIASSMITVAGVVFSITMVTLSLASSQFGPRLLRNFMRDTANQIVLGTFIATFLYCLLVLRTIRGIDEHEFVPHISVTAGVLLGVASLGVLIYFIHHVAVSIQASYIVSTVSHDLRSAIDRLFPDELGHSESAIEANDPAQGGDVANVQATDDSSEPNGQRAYAKESGYLQAIDNDSLFELAREHDLVIKLFCRPGCFFTAGTAIATITPCTRSSDAIANSLSEMFIIGRERTSTQDVEFVVSQLVEVALRALSPGINDPFTAISCIDWLADGLSQLAGRVLPSTRRFDSEGNLRIIADSVTFRGVADIAFNQIRQAGQSHPVISIRLLDAISAIASQAHRAIDIQCLSGHAQLIWQNAWQESLQGADRLALESSYQSVQRAINKGRTQ
ncbi:MAG: DUF2254 domain-containing protein [Pirellulaceae bacterium]|nr:DUF2254 domain-containing protein [Pirellulaceae bacterium]